MSINQSVEGLSYRLRFNGDLTETREVNAERLDSLMGHPDPKGMISEFKKCPLKSN